MNSRAGLIRAGLAALTLSVSAGSVVAKERADFIKGLFATEKGCDQLKALSEGKAEASIKTVPEVLSRDGFDGWEFACEFTKIHKHNQSTWVALVLCQEGPQIGASNMVFSKLENGAFEVFSQGQEEPDLFQLCAVENKGNLPKVLNKPGAGEAAKPKP